MATFITRVYDPYSFERAIETPRNESTLRTLQTFRFTNLFMGREEDDDSYKPSFKAPLFLRATIQYVLVFTDRKSGLWNASTRFLCRGYLGLFPLL